MCRRAAPILRTGAGDPVNSQGHGMSLAIGWWRSWLQRLPSATVPIDMGYSETQKPTRYRQLSGGHGRPVTPIVRYTDGTNGCSGSFLLRGPEHTVDRGRAVVVRHDLSAELDDAVDG